MKQKGSPIYTERSPWSGWLLVIFWGTMLLTMAFVAVAPGESEGERRIGLAIIAGVAVLIQVLGAGLTVRLYKEVLVVGLGYAGWISKTIPFSAVRKVESVTYQPLLDFGGWGVRWGKDGAKAWTARGNKAVVLHLEDGTRLYVGSDAPQRLEERIRAVAGTRMQKGGDPEG